MRAIPCLICKGAWLHPAAGEHSAGCRSSAERQQQAAAHTEHRQTRRTLPGALQNWSQCYRGALKQHKVLEGSVLVQLVLLLVPAVLFLGLSQALCFGKLREQEFCSAYPYSSVSYHQATFQGSTAMQCLFSGTMQVLGTCTAFLWMPCCRATAAVHRQRTP